MLIGQKESDERDTDPGQTPAQAATQVCGLGGRRGDEGEIDLLSHTFNTNRHGRDLSAGSLRVFNPAVTSGHTLLCNHHLSALDQSGFSSNLPHLFFQAK